MHVSFLLLQCPTDDGSGQCASTDTFKLQHSQEIKILVVGDRSVGKTALVQRFLNGTFSWQYNCTVSLIHAHIVIGS